MAACLGRLAQHAGALGGLIFPIHRALLACVRLSQADRAIGNRTIGNTWRAGAVAACFGEAQRRGEIAADFQRIDLAEFLLASLAGRNPYEGRTQSGRARSLQDHCLPDRAQGAGMTARARSEIRHLPVVDSMTAMPKQARPVDRRLQHLLSGQRDRSQSLRYPGVATGATRMFDRGLRLSNAQAKIILYAC